MSDEDVDAVFIFIGTRPRSDWLPEEVLRDSSRVRADGARPHGPRGLSGASWKQLREPLPLETSVPGVFAAGYFRASAMNRVASAVGKGSMVVRCAHDYLALT